MKLFLILLTFFMMMNISVAGVEVHQFNDKKDEQRYRYLINELRCLVCQNQSLADSNAELAQDLRKQVLKMINAGQSDEEILEFMVSRYGDFVLYRPPFKATTLFLWLGPFIILAVGLLLLIRFIRQRKKIIATEITGSNKEKIKLLLED